MKEEMLEQFRISDKLKEKLIFLSSASVGLILSHLINHKTSNAPFGLQTSGIMYPHLFF